MELKNGVGELSVVDEPRALYDQLRDRGYCAVAVRLGEGLENGLVQSWETTFKAAFEEAQSVKDDKGAYRADQQVAVGYRREDQREFLETRLYTDGRVDPSFPEVPRYDDTVRAMFGLLSQIAECVLKGILSEIGLDPRSILDLTDLQDCLTREPSSSSTSATATPSSSLLRVCSYPSTDEGKGGFAENEIAFGAHTDTSFLTVAPASSVPGLEVWNRQTRQWVLVEAEELPRSQAQQGPHLNVVVFVGEFLQVLTKTHFRALVHRVRAPSTTLSVNRVSCPFIIRGKLSALVDVGNTTKYAHGPEAAQHVADLDGVTMKLLHKMLDLKRQKTVKANEGRAAKGEPWVLTSYPDLEPIDHALSQPQPQPQLSVSEAEGEKTDEDKDEKGQSFPWLSFVALLVAYTYSSVIKRSFHSCMGVLSVELSLSKADLGLVSSSFSAAYGASKLLGGVLSDRMSNRALFVGGLVLGGACNGLMSRASGAFALSVIWAANGLVQGASVPALQALVTQGFPKSSVSTVWAAILCGGNVGYLASPFALIPAVERWGSRAALAGCGAGGVLLGLLAALVIRDRPRLSSSAASARGAESGQEQGQKQKQKQKRVPSLWGVGMEGESGPDVLHALSLLVASCLTLFTLKSMADWGTMFLAEGVGLSSLAAAEVAVWSELGGIAGSFFCGVACDSLFSGDAARASGVFSALCGVSCLALLPSAAPLGVPRQAALFLAGFFVNGPKTLLPLAAARAAPRGSEGSFAGLLGLAGQAGSTVSGSGVAWLLEVWGWDFYPWALASSALLQAVLLLLAPPLKVKTD